jgi:D-glycero-D-manno-heptose 1,7-bisphosphate phosphatase
VRAVRPYAPRRLTDFRLLPGVKGAVTALKDVGFLVIVVTNQPDLASGLVAREVVDAMHARLRVALPVDAIEVCPHAEHEGCDCRKPAPGLLVRAAERLSVDLRRSWMVGDRWKDIVAGRQAGCCTVFVDRGYRERRGDDADLVVGSLPAAVPHIIARTLDPAG